ncbi:MAG: alpha/beta hydrolase family protein, partial [Nitrobacter sp.]
KMRIFLIVMLILFFNLNSASATEVGVPWHGDYPHNSSKHWSKGNPYDSGFSNNFMNGTPEEGGKVQKDGELIGKIYSPETSEPIPFMIVMHGCTGLDYTTEVWVNQIAKVLNAQGIGVMAVNSFRTRSVQKTCGMPDFHWGRRRADDAYSALDYLIEHKLAKPDEVYLMGQSNGGLATLIAMSKQEDDHPHRFAAGFPVVPSCINTPVRYGDYVRPMIIFGGDKDDANPVKYCVEMLKKKRADPIQLIIYKDANHGFMFEYMYPLIIKGWVDPHGKEHYWHLSSNHAAGDNMLDTILDAMRTKTFTRGVTHR